MEEVLLLEEETMVTKMITEAVVEVVDVAVLAVLAVLVPSPVSLCCVRVLVGVLV